MNEHKILIIIPAYNEEECILNTYESIQNYNDTFKTNYEVIVINDCSKDGTDSILVDNNIPHISLVHNLGIGGAVQTGYKFAKDGDYDIAIQFDGDGQHDVHSVQEIINPILSREADFVIGSRFIDKSSSEFQSSLLRRLGIKLISFCTKLITGVRIWDTTSGFRAANKEIIKDFASSYPVEYPEPVTNAELLKKKFSVKEVPVKMHEREGGESSIKAWKTVYYMINVILTILIIGTRRYPHVK